MNCRTEDGDCKKSADSAQPRCVLCCMCEVDLEVVILLHCYNTVHKSTLSHGVFELMNRCEDDDVVMEF